jgi:hypothetical protein
MIDIKLLSVGENRRFGVEVIHKDGSMDYYSTLEDGDVTETETEYLLDNGRVYREPKDNVVELRRREVCQECGCLPENCSCPGKEDDA